jgi:hypothetical protein
MRKTYFWLILSGILLLIGAVTARHVLANQTAACVTVIILSTLSAGAFCAYYFMQVFKKN